MPNLLTAQEAASFLGVSVETVITRTKAGALVGSFVNHRWRYWETDLVEFVDRQRRTN